MLALMERLQALRLGDARLPKAELSLPKLALLHLVARSPGARVQDIAKGMGLTAPTVSVGIHYLLRKGWLRREADPEDRRATRISLTAKAEKLMEKVKVLQRSAIADFLAGLDMKDQQQLLDLLERAVSAAEQRNKTQQKQT